MRTPREALRVPGLTSLLLAKSHTALSVALAATALAAGLPETAHALSVEQISLGAGYATPLGDQRVGLGDAAAFQFDVFASGFEALGPGVRVHSSLHYQKHDVSASSTADYHLFSATVGLSAQGGAPNAFFRPYFSLLVGAAVDWLSLSGFNSQINSSLGFAARAVPGVEFPIAGSLTGSVSMPVQHFVLGRPLSVWQGLVQLRYAL
jgi:hypothetical protein